MGRNFTISVVIPNYNGESLLAKNLPSILRAFEVKDNHIAEVIVVDDGSTDGSAHLIKESFKKVILVQHKKNRGFPAAVNTGVRSSRGSIVALLNTDVSVAPSFLKHVIGHFSNRLVFAVSFHEEGFGWAKGFLKNGFVNHSKGGEGNKTHDTFWVNGGSGAFRRSMWMKLKGMDEALFSPFYWEDLDICYRATKRGWKLYWEPKAKVEHEHESTTSKINQKYRQRIQERNQLIFIWKNITSSMLTRKHLSGLIQRLVKHPGYISIVFSAFLKTRVIIKARSVEKRESQVSDESIFAKFS